MSGDDDEIWRPDYVGPPPRSSPPTVWAPTSTESVDLASSGRMPARSARRILVGVGAVAAALVAAVAVVTVNGQDDPPRPEASGVDDRENVAEADAGIAPLADAAPVTRALPDIVATSGVAFAGADPRRLPAALDRLWSTSVDAGLGGSIDVDITDDAAIVVRSVDDGGAADATLVRALDLDSGDVRWDRDVVAAPDVRFVTAGLGVVVLVVGDTLVGLDADTGADVWEVDRIPGFDVVSVERLDRTDLMEVPEVDGTSTLVHIADGEIVGRLSGPTISTDHLGRWYVRSGADVVEYDLRDGYAEPTLFASGVDDPVAAVVGRNVVASGPNGWSVSFASGDWVRRTHPAFGGVGDFPSRANAVVAMLGPTFLAAGEGSIVGADVDGRELRFAWERQGVLTAVRPTERGFVVLVSSRSGASQDLVDGRTGETITALTLTPGFLDSLTIAGNGILLVRTSPDGKRRAALDLDGNELWSIDGVDAAVVGDGIVVTVVERDGVFELVGLGDGTDPSRVR